MERRVGRRLYYGNCVFRYCRLGWAGLLAMEGWVLAKVGKWERVQDKDEEASAL